VPDETASDALNLAERRCANVERIEIPLRTGIVRFTASFGATDASAANLIEELIECADQALYEAKNSGRNAVQAYREKPRFRLRPFRKPRPDRRVPDGPPPAGRSFVEVGEIRRGAEHIESHNLPRHFTIYGGARCARPALH
jgi:hypothetical protein